jgi:DNA-binding transcriptional regulator LsrR (DeoR family)
MRKISEVLRQYHALNYSHRDIARSLNLGKTTVTRYLALADAASISWPLPEGLTEEAL